ncbi:AraC family transcriptional regulator [Pseudomonas serboccidentalis]
MFRAWFEQIGVSAEAMMAVGRLVIRPFSANQLAAFPQNREQTIPANMELLLLTLLMHHRMQLASADARLASTDLLYKRYDLLILVGPSPVDPVAFVIGLTAYSHKLASPADTQGLGLRNDLPGRFFTTDTP